VKSAEEIMNLLDAFDLTGSLRDAGELAGVSHHTVARYVAARESGVAARGVARPMLVDEFLPKVEEWIERSHGRLRADVAHDKLLALGFTGSERTTRRAVAVVKKNYRLGRVRVHRPWVTEPGMWLQYDFGDGPVIDGAKTTLFCAWLAWSRFRVVLAIRDKSAPSVMAALGGGARLWLTEAAAAGTTKVRVKMAQAVTLAKLFSVAEVDQALGHAAVHARFGHGDLASILDHHAATATGPTHRAGEDGSLTQGTSGWAGLGATPTDLPHDDAEATL